VVPWKKLRLRYHGVILTPFKKQNKCTVYYFFSPNSISQHRFVLRYRQTETTLLRNFRMYISRWRNIQKMDYKIQSIFHSTSYVSFWLFHI
jgi:hypothetical protein